MKKLIGLGLLLSPLAAFATNPLGTTNNLYELIGRFSSIIGTIVPFIIGLAVLVIIWGLFNYIVGAGDEEKRGEAKQYIIWGIIGLFVMVSIWGLVGIVKNTLNIGKTSIPTPSVVPCPAGSTAVFNNTTGTVTCSH